jgi:hypothetical protein
MKKASFACLLAILLPCLGHAAESYIRLTCDEDDKGSDVILDGEYKGKCPIDLTARPGPHYLEVATRKDGEYKAVYGLDTLLGAGVAQRIEVPKYLSAPVAPEWRAFWKRKTPFPALLKAVKAGDPVAKAEMAQSYMVDAKGCYMSLTLPDDAVWSITWSGACKGGAGSGYGELVWSSKEVPAYGRQIGNYVQGEIEGKGKLVFHNGENFEGMFVHGKKVGYGVESYSDGRRRMEKA